MKCGHIQISLFILFLFLTTAYSESTSANLEEMLNASLENSFDTDSEEVIMKMKNFFDIYANKLKNNQVEVEKLILPGRRHEYVRFFSPEDLNRQTSAFVEESNKMRENDLKTYRDAKQNVEEKNIDLVTKNKILKSRLNSGTGEKNKFVNDLNEKNNLKVTLDTEIKEKKRKAEELVKDDLGKIKNLKNDMKEIENKIKGLKLNQKVFEDELAIEKSLETYKAKIFKSDFDLEFFKNQNITKTEFINKAKDLEILFLKGYEHLKNKIQKAELRVQNKTETLNKIRSEIKTKYETYDNLNNTIHKLKDIQTKYKSELRGLEDNITMLKSKKSIISENIAEKNKHRKIRKQNIESVLQNLEKKLDKYNVDKINVNKYRKDISKVNNRIRNLLQKENMIFKKNKIKI